MRNVDNLFKYQLELTIHFIHLTITVSFASVYDFLIQYKIQQQTFLNEPIIYSYWPKVNRLHVLPLALSL